ncbi:MAG: hypothetical protein IJR53_06715 [Bacteroidales bacterium]|nr:hypothetical protein [Bacteroidales bacterium]
MYLHVFKCNECRYYQTDNCPWKGTKENNVACEGFAHTDLSTSGTGTLPISGFGLSLVSTAVSTGGPIEIG